MNREEKAADVALIREKLTESQSAMLVDFRKLDVESTNTLRRQLRSVSAELKVSKNTLTRLAIESTGLDCLEDELNGPTGIVFSYGDPVASAKIVADFQKTNPALQVKSGHLGGKALNPDEYTRLAKLPGREALLAQVVGTLSMNVRSLVVVLSGVQRKLVYALQAIKEKKEEVSTEPTA